MVVLPVILIVFSCKKFVDVGSPFNEPGAQELFSTDAGATGAVLGVYAQGIGGDGLIKYYTVIMGASADETDSKSTQYQSFKAHNVPITNFYLSSYFWGESYSSIMNVNQAIDGLSKSQTLTPAVKNQLLGEMYFWRAYLYFYLTNMFGNVPMPLGTDVKINAVLGSAPQTQVYNQIVDDLKKAQGLLTRNYPGAGYRTRVNLQVLNAFLSRVYLYQKKWVQAELEATKVIEDSEYQLAEMDGAFVNDSQETILQLSNTTGISTLGRTFRTNDGLLPSVYLNNGVYDQFEDDDLRRSKWTAKVKVSGQDYIINTKYKKYTGSGNEYDVMIRLAEIYLIRAESLINQDKIDKGVEDLNMLRERARPDASPTNINPLPDILTTLTKPNALLAVEKERRRELFAEFGHRWLDLKRTPSLTGAEGKTRADDIFGTQVGWSSDDLLYPIPDAQIKINVNLGQNPGYPQ